MMQNENEQKAGYRSGFVALVGRPNVGKSTLTNALLGEKVSIVTPKAQTTRTRIHGILNRDDYQMVLVDTPGFCGSETPLRRVLRRLAGTTPANSDLTLIVTEISRDRPELNKVDLEIIDAAQRGPGRVVLAINKVDRVKHKELLLPWIERYVAETDLEAVIPISAKYGDGLDVLEVVSQPTDTSRVRLLSWVCVEDEEGGTRVFRIVGADETNASAGWISRRSPVGRALLGKEPDDEIPVTTPRGPVEYVLVDIYAEEPSGV